MDAREAKGRPTQRSENYSKVDQEEEEEAKGSTKIIKVGRGANK